MATFQTFLIFLFSTPGFAAPSFLAKYCDCVTFQTPSVPVFVRSAEGNKVAEISSHVFQDCLDINLNKSANGTLEIQVGDLPLKIDDLTKGPVSMGVFDKAMHTFQIKDWDDQKGGKLQFGYLSQFSILEAIADDDFKVLDPSQSLFPKKRARTAQEIQEKFATQKWKSYTLNVRKNAKGEWILTNEDNLKVTEIYGQLKAGSILGLNYVNGIAKMLSSGPIQSACDFNPRKPVETHLFINTSSSDSFSKLGCKKSK